MTKFTSIPIGIFLWCASLHAMMPEKNLTAIGQGVASPSATSFVNVGRGLMGAENPAGLMFIEGLRVSAEMTKDGQTSANGFEGSYSGKTYGIGVGSYNPGCSGCLPTTAAILGLGFKSVHTGLRYQTLNNVPTYGLGLVINPTGKHRLGVHVENEVPEVKDNSVLKTGFGYSYSDDDDTINLETSQSKTSTASSSMNSIGYRKKVSQMEVTMTYEMDSTGTDRFWMGAGFRGRTFHLADYSQYNTQLMLVLSAFF